jgi:hypothetical protein
MVMKRSIVVVLVMGLLAGGMLAGPAEAKKKKKKLPVKVERIVEIDYSNPGIGAATPAGSAGYPVNFPDGVDIPTTGDDLFIKIEVLDASGQKVGGFISQGDLDGNGVNDDGYAEFCGAHPEPVSVASPGMPIIGIYAYNGVCPDGSPSVMTSGTIKITFSNMP